ncbi:MAG: hypothetical protein K8953_10400, partial [Proteobacteria bacterium]|nr:hypothetical protein [Pseudomonadota bacterium]
GLTSAFCGDEDTAGTYIFAYCATAAGNTNAAYCPVKYAGAVGDTNTNLVNVSDLTGKALNVTGTALLTGADGTANTAIIAAGGAKPATDPDTNFIVGTSFSLGANTSGNGGIRLSVFGISTDRETGYFMAVGVNAPQKHYVGLLATTNLGAPLPTVATDGATTVEWAAKAQFLLAGSLQPVQDFTLLVGLSDKTIRVRPGSIASGARFVINGGGFTDNGLLYGRFVLAGSSYGTLTGLIGQTGAVGIAKSDPGSFLNYVGGFVARGLDITCSAEGSPFNVRCTGNNVARAQLCRAWATDGLPIGVSVKDDCAGDPAVVALICADNGANANPFDMSICTSDQTSTQATFLANC